MSYAQIGLMLGKAMFGVSDSEFAKRATFVDTLHDADEQGCFHKEAAVLGAMLYEKAGRQDRLGYHLFRKLASHEGPWSHAMTDMVIPIYIAVGNHVLREKSAADGGMLTPVTNLLGGLMSKYPTMLGISALLGGGVGALGWQAKQDDIEDDTEAARTQAQLDYLNSVTDEIDEQLGRKGIVSGAQ